MLAYLRLGLSQMGEELKRTAHTVLYLLQATPEEKKTKPCENDDSMESSPSLRADSTFLKRTQIIFEHDLLPTFIALGRDSPPQTLPIDGTIKSETSSTFVPFITYYVRRRIKHALYTMHSHLKSHTSAVVHAHWSLLDEYVNAQKQQPSPPTSPDVSTTCTSISGSEAHEFAQGRPTLSPTLVRPRRRVRIHRAGHPIAFVHVGDRPGSVYSECEEIIEELEEMEAVDVEVDIEISEEVDETPVDHLGSMDGEEEEEPDIYASSSSSGSADGSSPLDSSRTFLPRPDALLELVRRMESHRFETTEPIELSLEEQLEIDEAIELDRRQRAARSIELRRQQRQMQRMGSPPLQQHHSPSPRAHRSVQIPPPRAQRRQ